MVIDRLPRTTVYEPKEVETSESAPIEIGVQTILDLQEAFSVHFQIFRPQYLEIEALKWQLLEKFHVTDEEFEPMLTQAQDVSDRVIKQAIFEDISIQLMLGPKPGENFLPLVGRRQAIVLKGPIFKETDPCTIFIRDSKTLRPRDSKMPKGAFLVPPIHILGVFGTSSDQKKKYSIQNIFLPDKKQLKQITQFLERYVASD